MHPMCTWKPHLLLRMWGRVRNSLAKGKYTPYTMAEYLRKAGARVGDGCFIGPPDIEMQIDPHLLQIGNHVAIASGVSFLAHDGTSWPFHAGNPPSVTNGSVIIGDNCFIGYRAILYPNIRIGPNAVVGAGSVVTSDVSPNTLVMGVPARPFGSIEKYREKCIGRWSVQRPPEAVIEPHETWWTTRHMLANRERLKKHLLALFRAKLV
jgi:acetyltransferase-like isoleucine patch superfamily enzyme